MISAKKVIANQTNAQASKGPRTEWGKTRAAQNARRHGLSLPICTDPSHSKEIESLAQGIAGKRATSEIFALARQIAEAQIDLIRIRQAQYEVLSRNIENSHDGSDKVAVQLMRIGRYERRALSRRKFAIRVLDAARHRCMIQESGLQPTAISG